MLGVQKFYLSDVEFHADSTESFFDCTSKLLAFSFIRNLGFKAISITSGDSPPSQLNSTSTELNSGLNYRGFTTASGWFRTIFNRNEIKVGFEHQAPLKQIHWKLPWTWTFIQLFGQILYPFRIEFMYWVQIVPHSILKSIVPYNLYLETFLPVSKLERSL